MNNPIQLTDTIPTIRTSIGRSLWRHGFLLIPLAIAVSGLALLPTARAVCQEGCFLSNANTVLGEDALISLTTGVGNTATGSLALERTTTGDDNTATGGGALELNTTGSNNTATGHQVLFFNTTGGDNTANGFQALYNNTASYNTAFGGYAMYNNTTGTFNTANGFDTLYSNTTGQGNTASGDESLFSNTTGGANTATGETALYLNTTGSENTGDGVDALFSNTTGNDNTAVGTNALYYNTIGISNTATGEIALQNNPTGNSNTAIGHSALLSNTSGGSNIALGDSAGINLTTTSNNIDIGNKGVAGDTGKIRIGKKPTHTATFIQGISGVTVAGGVGVLINTSGQLGTIQSSARVKDEIKPMDKASEAILALHPVTFHYKKDLDPEAIPQFGLVAEQVEKVNPDLVARDDQGKPYTVRYEAVNAMLLNEFLKEHRKVAALEATVAVQQKGFEAQQKKSQTTAQEQQQEIAALTAALKEQAVQIQKVSDQLKTPAPAPRMVAND